MIGLLLSLFASPLCAPPESGPGHSDASLEFEGELLDHRFVDLNGSGQLSLCVAIRLPGGRRQLRIHSPSRRGYQAEEPQTISVLEDVLAYTFADVRKEKGKELVFLTRTGAYSYSLTLDGYRGNIQRLLTDELIYDVPDNRSLPYWGYVIKADGGDRILMPGRDEFAVFGPARRSDGEVADPYVKWSQFGSVDKKQEEAPAEQSDDEGSVSMTGSGQIRVDLQNAGEIFLVDSERSSTLLADGKSYPAPALVDLNGDDRPDLVLRKGDSLRVHIAGPNGIPSQPTRVEELPDYLLGEDLDLRLEFAHLNGDKRLDLVARVQEEVDGFENAQIRVLILLNDGRRLIPEQAQQVFRFEAAVMRVNVVDVNGDGLQDLLMRKFMLPSLLETVSGLEFELSYLLYLAEDSGSRPFERKPVLNQSEVFDESNFGDAVKSRHLRLDCDGDGVPDLVEVDLNGRIGVRRLRHESGFFSGDSWELDESPWKRFDTRGAVLSLEVLDVNDDGIADIVSPSRDSLTLLLSTN